MIDIHTHILHECDDGALDLDTSLRHLKILEKSGVADLFLTPHNIQNSDMFADRLTVRVKFKQLLNAMKERGIRIQVHLGAEVYLDSQRFDPNIISDSALGDSDYILVETSMSNIEENIYMLLYDLVKSGYRPILAHPERYSYVIDNPEIALDLIHKNVYIQINAGSLLGHYGKRSEKTAWHLIEQGWCHFVASDTHCQNPNYTLPYAVDKIERQIDEYTARLLSTTNPYFVLKNTPIDYFYLAPKAEPYENSFFDKIKKMLGNS